MKKDDRRTLIVVLVVCIICGGIIYFSSRKSNYERLLLVKDYTTFFSVTREVNNYINSISRSDKSDIINLLDSRYVDNNSIDILLDTVNYSPLTELSANNIKYVMFNKNYLYLVKGKIVENDFDYSKVIDENDVMNNSYSIYPVDNDNYKKIVNSIKKINIDSNSSNKMIVSNSLSDVDVCKLYFSDYISKIFNNPEEAYKLLSSDTKKRFTSYDEFSNYIDNNIEKFTSISKLCRADKLDDNRIYRVIDENNNSYTFNETGVMNYQVNFTLNSD